MKASINYQQIEKGNMERAIDPLNRNQKLLADRIYADDTTENELC